MSEQDVPSTLHEMMAQITSLRAELTDLKTRTIASSNSQPWLQENAPTRPPVSTTRRKTLARLGLALLGGAGIVAAAGKVPTAQAKVTDNPTLGTSTSKAGTLITLLSAPSPINNPPNGYNYGLLVSGKTTALDYSTLPASDTGIYSVSNGIGVYSSSVNSYGVYGTSPGVSSIGVSGVTSGSSSIGVYGNSPYIAIYGTSTSTSGFGVYGTSTSNFGVYGYTAANGSRFEAGVKGEASGVNAFGVTGYASGSNGVGVYGEDKSSGHTGHAGYFQGLVGIQGSLVVANNVQAASFNGGSKSFKIDHPIDPANKYLYHTSIESPDMKNVYDGLTTLDEQGEAVVEMPDWFEALNSDFRYQLTSMDQFSPVFVAERIKDRQFKIAGGLPGQEINWQVTGIRQDAFARTYRTPVEQDKTPEEQGKFLHPEAFGQPREMAVNYRKVTQTSL